MDIASQLREDADKLRRVQIEHPFAHQFSVTWISAGNLATRLDLAAWTIEELRKKEQA